MRTTLLLSAAFVASVIIVATPGQAGRGPDETCIEGYEPCIDHTPPIGTCDPDNVGGYVTCAADLLPPPPLPCGAATANQVVDCVRDLIPPVDHDVPCGNPRFVGPWTQCMVELAKALTKGTYCMLPSGFVDWMERWPTAGDITLPPPDCD